MQGLSFFIERFRRDMVCRVRKVTATLHKTVGVDHRSSVKSLCLSSSLLFCRASLLFIVDRSVTFYARRFGKSLVYCFGFNETISRHRSSRYGFYFVSRERQSKQSALLGGGKRFDTFPYHHLTKTSVVFISSSKTITFPCGRPVAGSQTTNKV